MKILLSLCRFSSGFSRGASSTGSLSQSIAAIRLPGVALLAGALLNTSSFAADTYHFSKEIAVGGPSSWDYLSVDPVGRRIYASHGTEVVVIDIDKDAVAGVIKDTPGVHGMAVAPDLARGVTSNGRENKASLVDLKTLETVMKIPTGQNPDGMIYEPSHHEAYLFNGRGDSATVIDVKSGNVTATIPLGGKPEFGAADPELGRVFDNLEDKSEVVAIDISNHTVANHWPIAPGEEASGMAIDTAHHRLFLGCHNSMMIMMDASNGKVAGSVPIGTRVDANAFDPGTQLAFASCGDGTVTIAHEDAPDKLTVVQTLKTQSGARTMTIDPKTHKIYLSQGDRKTPDSFKVLVYEMQ